MKSSHHPIQETAMFVVRADGFLCFTNDAGRHLLKMEEAETRRAIAGALRGGASVRLKSASEAEVFLVVVGARDRPAMPDPIADAAARWGLTPRESEVVALIVCGDANKDVARQLDLSARTVELHISTILRKAGVESRARLIAHFWAGSKDG
jgi:DNA-binding NarL/FixJ family response regulator